MANSLVITSWTEASVSVGTTAVEVAAVQGQKAIRLYPLASGTFYFGFSSSVTAANGEKFSQSSPITIMTDKSIWLIRASGAATANVRAMKGA